MERDILAELDEQLTDVNLEKYWVKKVGDYELWLTVVDYENSNRVKKAMEGEFGFEEAKRRTLSAAIVGVNGVDFRPLRRAGKTLKVKGKVAGKDELVDLPEYVYRKIASWDVEFVEVVFDVYTDIMESHKKALLKDLVFENARTDEEELEFLEEKVAALRQKLDMPPLVAAARIDLRDDAPEEEQEEDAPEEEEPSEEEQDVPPSPPGTSFVGDENAFDPFSAVPLAAQSSAPSPLAVPIPSAESAMPTTPSAIERAMANRRGSLPIQPQVSAVPAQPFVAQPSVPEEVIEKSSARVLVAPPNINPSVSQQNQNPRFRRATR